MPVTSVFDLKVSEDRTVPITPAGLPLRAIGLRFDQAITASGLTVSEIARKVGIRRAAVYEIVQGKRRVDTEELKRWCQVLEVEVKELIG